MSDRFHDVAQGTYEWLCCRMGKVTGSKISDVMSKGRGGGESVGRRNYRAQLALERINQRPIKDEFYNSHMRRGNALESDARIIYEFRTGAEVKQIGFVDHAIIDGYGVSPDGMVGKNGLVQIKCPIPSIHMETLFTKTVPSEYVKQMQAEMDCTDCEWNDFVSYNEDMPIDGQIAIVRLYRDDKIIHQEMRPEIIRFLAEVETMVERLKALR